jgi:glycosyltransferase involved in cell wall biosynthesis
MRILLLNCSYDVDLTTPDNLLDRYTTLTGWSEALLAAGASCVSVLQRFGSDVCVVRHGVEYCFRKISVGGWPRLLRRIVSHVNPDVVHVNGLIFPWQTWWLRRALPARRVIVVQDHGGAQPSRNPFRSITQRIGLGVADGFLFSAAELAAPWQRARLIPPHQSVFAVMESSTAMRPAQGDQTRTMSGVLGRPAMLWVGRLNANKDPLTVLEGFERALCDLPDAHLTMIFGSEEWLAQVQTRIARSPRLTSHVCLRGYIAHDRLAEFYSTADLFLLGSHHEGSGYALIEAMACGATPIVTDIPSFRVLTGNGAVGAVWPVGDANALAAKIVDHGSRDLVRARAGVLNHFERELSWSVVGRRALAAYAEALRGKNCSGGL